MSLGYDAIPVGKSTRATALRKSALSQYNRADDAAERLTQYIITLSSSSSRVSTFSGSAVAVHPASEFLDDPSHLADRRIHQSVAQRLWPRGLLFEVTRFETVVVRQLGQYPPLVVGRLVGTVRRRRADRHGGVDRHAPSAISADLVGHCRAAPAAALGAVAVIAEADHQGVPRLGDLADHPTYFGGLAGEAITGKRRADHMKGVLRSPAEPGRVGKGLDHLLELDGRPGPAVGEQQWEGVGMAGSVVD